MKEKTLSVLGSRDMMTKKYLKEMKGTTYTDKVHLHFFSGSIIETI